MHSVLSSPIPSMQLNLSMHSHLPSIQITHHSHMNLLQKLPIVLFRKRVILLSGARRKDPPQRIQKYENSFEVSLSLSKFDQFS